MTGCSETAQRHGQVTDRRQAGVPPRKRAGPGFGEVGAHLRAAQGKRPHGQCVTENTDT